VNVTPGLLEAEEASYAGQPGCGAFPDLNGRATPVITVVDAAVATRDCCADRRALIPVA
jgi:hypothetical protein